jgi:hypothetical protein
MPVAGITSLNAPAEFVCVEIPSEPTATESMGIFVAESTTDPLIVSFIAAADKKTFPKQGINKTVRTICAFLMAGPFSIC